MKPLHKMTRKELEAAATRIIAEADARACPPVEDVHVERVSWQLTPVQVDLSAPNAYAISSTFAELSGGSLVVHLETSMWRRAQAKADYNRRKREQEPEHARQWRENERATRAHPIKGPLIRLRDRIAKRARRASARIGSDMRYEKFIQAKAASSMAVPVPHGDIAGHLFPHQRDLVSWALRRGRAAIFADTGLGKTALFLEWARHVSVHGRVLILAPLAVAEQIVREGQRFGVECKYLRADDGVTPIVVTNYEMLDRFDGDFAGVVLDESSILKAFNGKTRTALIERFAKTKWRLACTATPAPNDHTELGNHSEFLGIKTRVEMLSEYFVHDGGDTQSWRLKGHAKASFWRWVASWGAVVKRPSDLGHSDDGFALPPLHMHERIVEVDHSDARNVGRLFLDDARGLADQRATRRATLQRRVEIAAELARCDEPVLVWCELNDEADAITAAIEGAVQVRGSDDPDTKAKRLLGFADGEHRVLVSKASIAGFGMNWQHCARVVFAGASYSYEQTYQAIRRCWRFGQTRPVDVFVIRAETEGAVVAALRRKEADAERMSEEVASHMRDVMRAEIGCAVREHNEYRPAVKMRVPTWVGEEAA